jgi:propanol-preferring alcohol dehydrogenase
MPAVQLVAAGTVAIREVPVPVPGPGEVLIRVAAAGLCGSDLELIDAPDRFGTTPTRMPLTMGHEFSGWVAGLGAGVPDWRLGDLVVPYAQAGCGRCAACRGGEENLCAAGPPIRGIQCDGGLAEYATVDASALMSATGLDIVAAAGMTDAGMTAYHAASRAGRYLRGDRLAVVIGIGGVGHLAVQLLDRLYGAQVIAIDVDPAKLELAMRLGAMRACSFEEAEPALRDVTARAGFDSVIDMVGTSESLGLMRKLVRPGGGALLVGTADGQTPFGFGHVPRETDFSRLSGGTRQDLAGALAAVRSKRLSLTSTEWILPEALSALSALRRGTVTGRAMVRLA